MVNGRLHLSISRICDESVDSSIFNSFWQLKAFSECEATPCSWWQRVVLGIGISMAREADFFHLKLTHFKSI